MNILKLGDPRLRKRAAKVEDFGSSSFCKDIDSLKIALEEHNGMGIAAPQLGIDRRLLLIHSKPNIRYPNAPQSELMILINPEILSQSDKKELDWEGCLSVPNQRAKVWRSTEVKVSYFSDSGVQQEVTLTGFMARIFLHEYDHLEGKVFTDHVDKASIVSEAEYLANLNKI